jgi:hypothetical protein
MAIGYLMKGIPSFLFQAITLTVLFYSFDKWKNLLSWKHLVGIASGFLVIGLYYFAYNRYNSFQSVFDTLLDQSTRRTVIVKGIPQTLKYILEFPFEYIYHFLPWSILIILVFKKNLMTRILTNPFLKYCWYVFLFNIPIYWVSPGTLPRYILMLMPLLFTVLLAMYKIHREQKTIEIKVIDYILIATLIGSTLYAAYPMINSRFVDYNFRYLQSGALVLGLAYLTYRFIINEKNRLLTFILCILILRLGYNVFYLPEKAKETRLNVCKNEALRIADKYAEKTLKVDAKSKIGNLASFYITNKNQKILPRVWEYNDENSIYIFTSERLELFKNKTIIDSISVCEDPSVLYLVAHQRKNQ